MIIANWKSNMVDIFQWNNDFYGVYILMCSMKDLNVLFLE